MCKMHGSHDSGFMVMLAISFAFMLAFMAIHDGYKVARKLRNSAASGEAQVSSSSTTR